MKTVKTRLAIITIITLSLILGMAVGVSAGSIKKTIDVYYNDIKLVVDEKQVTPKDSSGKTVEPFTYNGTTYLPVRAVGEALGKEVNWDQTTQTVVIGKYDKQESLFPDIELYKMEDLTSEGHRSSSETVKDNFGESYVGNIQLAYYYIGGIYDSGQVEYALNGQYNKLKGRIILEYIFRNSEDEGNFQILLDGKVVKSIPYVKSGEEPVDFEIDVTGCNRLEIIATGSNHNYFVNTGLYK